MEDQENNISPEQPHDNSRNPKEDIPLWLQGLEEETKANRIQAAEGELLGREEEAQVSMRSDDSPESIDGIEPFSEDIEDDQEGFVNLEEVSQGSPDGESLSEPSETFEQVSEELEVMGDEPTPDDGLHEDFSTAETAVEESVEPFETPPEAFKTVGDGQALTEDIPEDLTPINSVQDIPEPLDASSDDLVTEEEPIEDDETEKISILSPDSLNDEDENLEWVNEITELDPETSNIPQDLSRPQNILGIDQKLGENELEESAPNPSSPSEEEQFLDISEVNVDDNLENLASKEEIEKEPTSRIIEIIQESEDSPFIEDKILSDNEESTFLEGEPSSIDEGLAFQEEEILPDDEELPKWLQRLIAESYPEDNFDQLMPLDEEVLNEITKPVVISSPLSPNEDFEEIEALDAFEEFEELEDFEVVDELDDLALDESLDDTDEAVEPAATEEGVEFPSEDAPVEFDLEDIEAAEALSPADEISLSEEDFAFLTDEDTQPVKTLEEMPEETSHETPVVIEEPIEWTEEDNLYFNPENGYLIEIPEPLQFARQVLKHGDITQGLEIIKTYISDDSFLDEIRIWLLEAAESRAESQSDIWESIGDIAASQDKHQEALAAYSKAINYLLSTKE